MFGVRAVGFALLMLGMAPFVNSQPEHDYPVCELPGFVGEVPNNPFIADLVEDAWRDLPEGAKARIDSKDDWGITILASQSPQFVGIVARDSQGRVVLKRRFYTVWHDGTGVIKGSESQGWNELICDPKTGQATSIHCSSSPEAEFATDNNLFDIGCDEGKGFAHLGKYRNAHTTATFGYWHRTVQGRDNFGLETFEGVPAYRYRLTRTHLDRSLYEVVNSDDMFAELAQIAWLHYPDSKQDWDLTRIRRTEPPLSFFRIPKDVTMSWPGAPKLSSGR